MCPTGHDWHMASQTAVTPTYGQQPQNWSAPSGKEKHRSCTQLLWQHQIALKVAKHSLQFLHLACRGTLLNSFELEPSHHTLSRAGPED